MLLEDRIRQSFDTALGEARGTLEAELQATLAAVHDEFERSRAAAAAEARSAAEAELTRAFDDEKAALAASHDAALQQLRSAAEAKIATMRVEADRALAALRADREGTAPDASPSHAVIETAVRHAGRCLEALTAQRAVQARTSAARVSTPA